MIGRDRPTPQPERKTAVKKGKREGTSLCFMTPNHRPLKVAVLVELLDGPEAGGHVKCWQRFADAARRLEGAIDLTVFFLGRRAGREEIAPNVRFERLVPMIPTDRIPGLPRSLPMTDLAPHHPALARRLMDFDVLHATSAFSFARTARRVARRRRLPLVTSIHDNLPGLTRAYMRHVIGTTRAARLVLGRLKFDQIAARANGRTFKRIVTASDWVLASCDEDVTGLGVATGTVRQSRLRRGIDKTVFDPRRRDRAWLHREFGVPENVPLLLFVGRIDDSKSVLRLADAAQRLLAEGQPLHVLVVGAGARAIDIQRQLGTHVTLPGVVPHPVLARVYASADMFVFPSETEIVPNVVLEARASGLPVVLSARDNGASLVAEAGLDGLIVESSAPEAWTSAIRSLLDNPERRVAMGAEARRRIERDWPTWDDVLATDLMPVWRRVTALRQGASNPTFFSMPVLSSARHGLL